VVDRIVDRRGTRAVAEAYLHHLYTPEGKALAARHFYRPREAALAGCQDSLSQDLELVTIDGDFNGWAEAQRDHFNDGGSFDRVYRPGR
jgi:ABC-type sulfate transport system substrate-binding protein